jgi:anti-sigma regulatory factor (Ser/Thr protein kinase)
MRRVKTFVPDTREIGRVYLFIEDSLAGYAPESVVKKLRLVTDEIFSNIVNHGFIGTSADLNSEERVEVRVDVEDGYAEVEFLDDGVPFDPLLAAAPDTSLGLSERNVGGLGIFLVRQLMDDVVYSRKNGRNSLTVKKCLERHK